MDPATVLAGVACLLTVITLMALKIVWEFLHEIRKMNLERFKEHEIILMEVDDIYAIFESIGVTDRVKRFQLEKQEAELESVLVEEDSRSLKSDKEQVGSPPLRERFSRAKSLGRKVSRHSTGQ